MLRDAQSHPRIDEWGWKSAVCAATGPTCCVDCSLKDVSGLRVVICLHREVVDEAK